ncbi:MAG TPA: beta-N-acetylhexosaminidase, partial [Bryobacteraceae bacterium]|nr:beta-N-acetylhexosaminidase [Bryobacteraceae bacterium]
TGDIQITLDPSRADLGEEGYELTVRPAGVRITAREDAGLFYGGQTLRQLLPAAAWRKAPIEGVQWTAPAVRIVDRPRFGWRGLLLDPARHFIPLARVLEIIDAMAMHKLNRLQLHLTDDQGWRVELPGFPLLTARSGWRSAAQPAIPADQPHRYLRLPSGGFYSRADVREIVAYAAARHIVVVPEIEMPAHSHAWLAAYPEFAVFPSGAARLATSDPWGGGNEVIAPRPQTMEACRRILKEIGELFPSRWIHTGGDEAPRDQWRESDEIQKMIRSLGLKNEDELQAWFTAQLSRFVTAEGRRLIGWDEILAGADLGGNGRDTSLSRDAIVMSWRGEDGGIAAAKAGHDVIMAPNNWTYLDYYQGPPAEEPLAIGGSVSLVRTYAYDPVPAVLPESAARHVLGAQTQVWGEYLAGAEAVNYMTFPRTCALAEAFWSPREGKSLNGFLGRLEEHLKRLDASGIAYRPLTKRTAWPDASGRVLASPQDAVIHGTEVRREADGTLAGWKDQFTGIAWSVQLPKPGVYRARLLLKPAPAATDAWIEAVIAGQALRSPLRASADALDLGTFKADREGARVLFLNAGGKPGEDGFAGIRGVELIPE